MVSCQQQMTEELIKDMAERAKQAESAALLSDQFSQLLEPVFEMMEPYLIHQTSIERGVPAIHEELDCGLTPNDA